MSAIAEKKQVETRATSRRTLRFETLDAAIAEAERVAALAREGKATCTGNWELGQILNHLGVWAEYAYGGNPAKAPFFIRWIARMFKSRFLYKGMPAGVRIPKAPGGTFGTEKVPVEQGLSRMTAAFSRLKTDKDVAIHPLFGRMKLEEYVSLNLRHAELHLSFVC